MTINTQLITTAIAVVQELFTDPTGADIKNLREHFGAAYNEGKIMAEIAVKLVLRLASITTSADMRALSPVDVLVTHAEDRYRSQYAI